MPVEPVNEAAGLYGKVPALGDFITRRLLRAFVDPWDEWLQSAMACSREQLGEAWLDSYLTSPLWRFALSPGACGEQAWAGVLMPSVDRVGRYFPLALLKAVPPDMYPTLLAREAADWYQRAEDLALDSLEENGFNMDEYDARVEALGMPLSVKPSHCAGAGHSQVGNAWHMPMQAGDDLHTTLNCYLQQMISSQLKAHTLWWTQGSERVAPCLLTCQGMPPIQGFAAMLGGAWDERVWRSGDAATGHHVGAITGEAGAVDGDPVSARQSGEGGDGNNDGGNSGDSRPSLTELLS